jgi:hypothetical protein
MPIRNLTEKARPDERVLLELTGQDVNNLVFCLTYLRRLYGRVKDEPEVELQIERMAEIIFPAIRSGDWREGESDC